MAERKPLVFDGSNRISELPSGDTLGGVALITGLQAALDGKLATPSVTNGNIPYWDGSAFADSGLSRNASYTALNSGYLNLDSAGSPASTVHGIGITTSVGIRYQVPDTYLHRFHAGGYVLSLAVNTDGATFTPSGSYFSLAKPLQMLAVLSATDIHGIGITTSVGMRYQVPDTYIHRFFHGTTYRFGIIPDAIYISDSGATPGNPSGGVNLYSDSGVLKYKDPGGTVHTVATI